MNYLCKTFILYLIFVNSNGVFFLFRFIFLPHLHSKYKIIKCSTNDIKFNKNFLFLLEMNNCKIYITNYVLLLLYPMAWMMISVKI